MSSFYKRFFVLTALILNVGGFAHSAPLPFKTTVTDIAGKTLRLPQPAHKATVLVFLAHDCPISNAYAPEITRIATDYAKHGVSVVLAYAESDFDAAGARKHARAYGYKMPAVLDDKYKLSHTVGATVTPEAVVYSPTGTLLYRGRIDNRFANYGKKRAQPSQRDLRAALDAIVAGRPVPTPTTTAVGCFIPEKAN
ncbi:redoxin domain-containing protein [bacterium]|nr:MAG: redoxin domain-containing protein [bacterium]